MAALAAGPCLQIDALSLAVLRYAPSLKRSPMSERRLTILQVNDLHGYLEPHAEVFRTRGRFQYETCGGLARIATVFKQVRAERPGAVLALDNGRPVASAETGTGSSGETAVIAVAGRKRGTPYRSLPHPLAGNSGPWYSSGTSGCSPASMSCRQANIGQGSSSIDQETSYGKPN